MDLKMAMTMTAKLFNTTHDWTPFILRVVLGGVVFAHGAQKLFGWFGGYGFKPGELSIIAARTFIRKTVAETTITLSSFLASLSI